MFGGEHRDKEKTERIKKKRYEFCIRQHHEVNVLRIECFCSLPLLAAVAAHATPVVSPNRNSFEMFHVEMSFTK